MSRDLAAVDSLSGLGAVSSVGGVGVDDGCVVVVVEVVV
jgi:hypothetical protein